MPARTYFAVLFALLATACEREAPKESWYRVGVNGSPECLAQITREAEAGIEQMPDWKDHVGTIQFGPVRAEQVELLKAVAARAVCARSISVGPSSCKSAGSDVKRC